MDHRRQQVERIARAFYDAQEEALDWDSAPKFLKEEFCQNARDAIALLEQRREPMPSAAKAYQGRAPRRVSTRLGGVSPEAHRRRTNQ
jgi:hypothetical protein